MMSRGLYVALCFLSAITASRSEARRDDGPEEVVATYYDPVLRPHRPAPKPVRLTPYIVDITNQRISFNQSLVQRPFDRSQRAYSVHQSQKTTTQRSRADESWLKKAVHPKEAGLTRPSSSTLSRRHSEATTHRPARPSTPRWQFHFRGPSRVVTVEADRHREKLLRAADGPRALPVRSRQTLPRTVLCLLVACLVLMGVLVCLVVAALWVRSRYRRRGGHLYSTLSDTDPEFLTPAAPSRHFPPEEELSLRTIPARDIWRRTVKGHSISEPAVLISKPPGRGLTEPLLRDAPSESAQSDLYGGSQAILAVTPGALKVRKSLHVQPSKPAIPQRSYHLSTTNVDKATSPAEHTASPRSDDDARGRGTSPGRHSWKERSAQSKRDSHDSDWDSRRSSEPASRALRASVSSPERLSSLSEDYHVYTVSDDARLVLDTSPGPLPTFIHRSVTKTTRRWRDRERATTTATSTRCSSLEAQTQTREAQPVPLTKGDSNESFENFAIIKRKGEPTEVDCCYVAADLSPWSRLLSLCKQPEPVRFPDIIHEDCEATKLLGWEAETAGGCGDVFRVLGSQGECLVRVMGLRPRDVPWYASRMAVARELSNLKNNVDNRTSAFFLGAKTSLVRDTYPTLLWDARLRCHKECQMGLDGMPVEDLQQAGDYLVTEMQPGWRPLTVYKLSHAEQCASVLKQACWALAVAEAELEFEHRLPGAGGVLVRPTHSPRVEFTLRGRIVRLRSAGIKIRLQRLHMARIRIGTRTESTDFTRFLEFARDDESEICASIAELISKRPSKFEPLSNVMWLQHLACWLTKHYPEASATLARWQALLAQSCSAQHATGGHTHQP